MIETKEQYNAIRNTLVLGLRADGNYIPSPQDVAGLIKTIEALREVASKAIAYEQTLAPFGSADEGFYHVGDEIALDNFQDALTALPDWLTDG